MNLLKGKKILIMGLINKYSIAYGIAQACFEHGAELAFTFQNEKIKTRLQKISSEFNSSFILPCNVTQDNEIHSTFDKIKKKWGTLNGLIHSIAFTPKNQIQGGNFIKNINRKDYLISQEISTYSLIEISKNAFPLMKNSNGSIITLSYYGAEKVIPNYNTMGIVKSSLESSVRYLSFNLGMMNIRINAISPGPIKTISSSRIKDFNKIKTIYKNSTPLQRNVSAKEIGQVAVFLCSDLSSGITGEIIHVDAGYHIMGITKN
ncbi:enoyl-ACP reductase [Candidatus Legionella polyplacis]|uniref:Enoyl-[acyl-carrier-protein] reductase [NADH] n=1 Tax=Candidatus Legionella polyplacis TaxID=2005262 RepID=A0ABZ2GXA8_9GAMM